ncbi:YIP1 family protein [Candidatus Saganbacteria bacterium]|nr:YIP1 family protein [Candidatus Saganbacteria bacterium]
MNLIVIIERARNLLLHPKEEWLKIAAENDDPKNVINFLAVITIVPALALFLGYGIVGLPGPYGYFRMSFLSAFFSALVFYILTAIAIALSTAMVSFFCHYFNIDGKWETYHKLIGYSATAPILANIFYIFPFLKFLKILGFYGAVTFFVGLPLLLKVQKEKEMQFVVTVLIAAIVITIIFFSLTDQFLGPIYSELL